MSEAQAFINRLIRARNAVRRGNTGCETEPTKCWYCAMRKRSEASGKTEFWDFRGPETDWSLKRPKGDTLRMFTKSIQVLRRKLNAHSSDEVKK